MADARPEDEVFEIVDETGRVVGAAPRSRCHGDPTLAHRVAHVFVRSSSGGYFLQKRSAAKRIQPGKWDTSVGGHLAQGESYEEAALRELAEELGVELARGPDGAFPLAHLHDYVWRSEVETEHVRTYLLVHDGPFRLHPVEIADGRFWSPDELRAAVGAGAFTPNLEEELRRLGVAEG